jgi:hypothetical protein
MSSQSAHEIARLSQDGAVDTRSIHDEHGIDRNKVFRSTPQCAIMDFINIEDAMVDGDEISEAGRKARFER